MGIELVPSARNRALALARERDAMEAEMEAINASLTVGPRSSALQPCVVPPAPLPTDHLSLSLSRPVPSC
jgi:hypothetical protein